jgi:DNA-directed RNA polymerase I, II, and III subunit RPABC2
MEDYEDEESVDESINEDTDEEESIEEEGEEEESEVEQESEGEVDGEVVEEVTESLADKLAMYETKINKIVEPNKRTTINVLTQYERAKLLGIRTQQLAQDPSLTTLDPSDIPPHVTSPYEIAKLELALDRFPLLVNRKMPDGSIEEWSTNELIKF